MLCSRNEKLGSSAATDGGASGVQKRLESRCSSTRRLPIASGRSGSASGASALHVTGKGPFAGGQACAAKRPLDSSYRRSMSAGVGERRPSASSQSACSTLVSTSHTTGPPASRTARIWKRSLRFLCTSSTNPGNPCARWCQIGSNWGEASRPDSSGCRIHSNPSPSRSRSRRSHSWWATIRGSAAGSPTAARHAQASIGGWIVDVLVSRSSMTL